ncbi:MAG: hypothetical protein IPJ34_35930 [Myxococcales bacterium]|nr:hypothetical protein [Myxococcales bacterium]
MMKEITVKELADELCARIDSTKGIDCCKEEIKRLAVLAGQKLGNEKILVDWKER